MDLSTRISEDGDYRPLREFQGVTGADPLENFQGIRLDPLDFSRMQNTVYQSRFHKMWDHAVFSEPLIASEREYSQSARTSAENSNREIFCQ